MAPTDSEIIETVVAGNTEAYGTLVDRYQKKIYNLMYRLTLSQEDACDLTQDAFLKAYEKLTSFSYNKKFLPWLYAIAVNLARDWGRREKVKNQKITQNRHDLVVENNFVPIERLIENEQEQEILKMSLQLLSFEDREALLFRFRDEMTMAEIAHVFQISTSGAKMRVKRALEKLLGKYYDSL